MKYRIWSHCVGAWWRPAASGYTDHVGEAGVYKEDVARAIHGRDHRSGCSCRPATLADEKIPAPDHSPRPARKRRGKTYDYAGEQLTLRELHGEAQRNRVDISVNALWHRLEISEWSVWAAVTTPKGEARTNRKTRAERANEVIDRTMREVSR